MRHADLRLGLDTLGAIGEAARTSAGFAASGVASLKRLVAAYHEHAACTRRSHEQGGRGAGGDWRAGGNIDRR